MQQKIPYGFRQFHFSNMTVFTGKVRIKIHREDLMLKLQNWEEHLMFSESQSFSKKIGPCHYTTVQFTVTNYHLKNQLVKAIRTVMCEIAHSRVDQKYADCVQWVEPSELPF